MKPLIVINIISEPEVFTTTDTTPTNTTPTDSPTPQGPDLMLAFSAGAIGAGAVIFGGGFIMFRKE